MNVEVMIKALDSAYLDAVTEVEQICFPPAEAAGREDFEMRFTSPAYRCFGAFLADGTMIGFVNGALYHEPALPDELYHNVTKLSADGMWQTIFGLNVLPQYRRQGIATKLIKTIIEESRRAGRKGVVLTCKDRLRPLYEAVGFEWQGVSASTHGNAVWNDMLLRF